MTMLARSSTLAARTVSRQVRALSTKEPKLHKAAGKWDAMKAKRPIDADDTHLCFHPPFNPATIYLLVGSVLVIGAGSMQFGFMHQQYKQGFWK